MSLKQFCPEGLTKLVHGEVGHDSRCHRDQVHAPPAISSWRWRRRAWNEQMSVLSGSNSDFERCSGQRSGILTD